MCQIIEFVLTFPPERDAGFLGGTEDVTVTLEAGGWDAEALAAISDGIRDVLAETLDCRCCTRWEYEQRVGMDADPEED